MSIEQAAISLQIFNRLQVPVVQLWLYDDETAFCREPGLYEIICTIPAIKTYQGKYSLTIHFADFKTGNKWDLLEEICPFEIVMFGRSRKYPWEEDSCTYIEESNWAVKNIDEYINE